MSSKSSHMTYIWYFCCLNDYQSLLIFCRSVNRLIDLFVSPLMSLVKTYDAALFLKPKYSVVMQILTVYKYILCLFFIFILVPISQCSRSFHQTWEVIFFFFFSVDFVSWWKSVLMLTSQFFFCLFQTNQICKWYHFLRAR